MAIRVICEGCKKAINAPDSRAGTDGKCPQCGAMIQIPPLIFTAAPIPPHSNDPIAKPDMDAALTNMKRKFEVSVTSVLFLLLAMAAGAVGAFVYGATLLTAHIDGLEGMSVFTCIHGVLWLNIAAILLVGAALVSQLRQLNDR